MEIMDRPETKVTETENMAPSNSPPTETELGRLREEVKHLRRILDRYKEHQIPYVPYVPTDPGLPWRAPGDWPLNPGPYYWSITTTG